MDIATFEQEVELVLAGLPDWVKERMDNVYVVVERRPTRRQDPTGEGLLGLYEGVPLTRRGRGYGMVLPDKITIFQKPIEARCRDESEIAAEVQRVVKHEIAHHFGISDARLLEIERGED